MRDVHIDIFYHSPISSEFYRFFLEANRKYLTCKSRVLEKLESRGRSKSQDWGVSTYAHGSESDLSLTRVEL